MLRSTDISPTHLHSRTSALASAFRFSEKRRPGGTTMRSEWLTNFHVYPANLSSRHLKFLNGATLAPQAVVSQTIKGLSFKNSRTTLMAKQGGFQRLLGTQQWQTGPWYRMQYQVERLDENFIQRAEGSNTIDAFIFLDRTSSFLSDWTSRFHKYGSTGL